MDTESRSSVMNGLNMFKSRAYIPKSRFLWMSLGATLISRRLRWQEPSRPEPFPSPARSPQRRRDNVGSEKWDMGFAEKGWCYVMFIVCYCSFARGFIIISIIIIIIIIHHHSSPFVTIHHVICSCRFVSFIFPMGESCESLGMGKMFLDSRGTDHDRFRWFFPLRGLPSATPVGCPMESHECRDVHWWLLGSSSACWKSICNYLIYKSNRSNHWMGPLVGEEQDAARIWMGVWLYSLAEMV